jgi:thiosulfate/3-mercaptopyruvate sulfurtransferase
MLGGIIMKRPLSWNVCALMVCFAFLGACGGGTSTAPVDTAGSPNPPMIGVDPELGTLVTAEWLHEHLGDEDLVILDCTVKIEFGPDGSYEALSGRADFEAGHIPGAGFADLLGELVDADAPHSFAVPTPEAFAQAMGALGVGDDTRVVLYDSGMSSWAARVWWMLRWVGFDRAALLDGGLGAWQAAGYELSTDPVAPVARELSISPRPELIADRDEVFAAIGDEAVTIVDALPEAHYRGEMVMYTRPGHIPGAINVPSMGFVGEDGRFKSDEELAAMHTSPKDGRTITYCGGGIAASSNAFVMTRLGYEDVAVYTASLQEWTADPSNPMETVEAAD